MARYAKSSVAVCDGIGCVSVHVDPGLLLFLLRDLGESPCLIYAHQHTQQQTSTSKIDGLPNIPFDSSTRPAIAISLILLLHNLILLSFLFCGQYFLQDRRIVTIIITATFRPVRVANRTIIIADQRVWVILPWQPKVYIYIAIHLFIFFSSSIYKYSALSMLEKFFTTHLFCCITRQTDKQNNKKDQRLGGKGCGRGTSCYIPHLDPIMFLFFIIHLFLFIFYLSYPNECQGRITYTLFRKVIGVCDWMWHVHRIDSLSP